MNLILASSSPRRKILLTELLKDLGHKHPRFKIIHANIDESRRRGEQPIAYARRLAKEKALSVTKKISPPDTRYQILDTVILAADTIVVLGKQIFGKPRNKRHATWMLSRLSGRRHKVITAFAIVMVEGCGSKVAGPKKYVPLPSTFDLRPLTLDHCISQVFFHPLSKQLIQSYVNSPEPHDKAGAYAIQGSKFKLVRKIKGSYTNVVGLPVEKVKEVLQGFLSKTSSTRK